MCGFSLFYKKFEYWNCEKEWDFSWPFVTWAQFLKRITKTVIKLMLFWCLRRFHNFHKSIREIINLKDFEVKNNNKDPIVLMWSDSQMFWIFSNHVGCANKRVLEELSFLTGNTVSMTCQLKGFICSLRVLDHRVTKATCIFKCHYFEKERIRLSWDESLSILGLYLKMNVSSSHCDATW